MASASGDWKPPVAASRGKFVGMRVPGIISFGRRIQSEIQSWRRRMRASVRFGASDGRVGRIRHRRIFRIDGRRTVALRAAQHA